MKSYREIYREWRWLVYNQLEASLLNLMVDGELSINIGDSTYSDNPNFKKYTQDKILDYKEKKFDVSQKKILKYDNNIYKSAKQWSNRFSSYSSYSFTSFYRSKFIENCYLPIDDFDDPDLLQQLKKNIIYYHWWDSMSHEELINSLIHTHFLKSTRKLITRNKLKFYISNRFKTKEDIIDYILSHFEPKKRMIQEMNVTNRGFVVFDYNWLFSNDLKSSIRIFENECRIHFDEKIIGSFYNENILFREIKKKFGKKYRVISQGSPEWLGIQRFDIYFPDLNIAIEYQGEQHQRPVDFGGKGKKKALEQFKENIKRDAIKKEKAMKNDCELIYVFPNYQLKKVIKNLHVKINNKTKSNEKACL